MKHQSWTESWLRLCVALCLVIGLVIATPGHAQNSQGTILGHVTDPTGAALAGAKVTIKNVNTNITREAATSSVGDYVFVNITPGIYDIYVEGAGFKKAQALAVTLNVDATLRQNFTLEVGAAAEQVTVEADAQMVQTDNASQGNVVSSKLIEELPIKGRDFTNLLRVQGGATTVKGSSQLYWAQHGLNNDFSSVSVNGARTESTSYLIDGVADNDQFFSTANNIPNTSAIQEFKVQNGMYSAEYGQGSAQVNVAIKNGTNQYHGSVYDYLQNDAFQPTNPYNAWRNYTYDLNQANNKDAFKQNQFGFTLGGPLSIPKLYDGKDKTFFFYSFEGGRRRTSRYQTATVPTELERQGNFTDWKDANGNLIPIYDPATQVGNDPTTRTAFNGNVIDPSRISSIGQKIANYFPLPNVSQPNMAACVASGGAGAGQCYNYVATVSTPLDTNNHTFRVDQNFGSNDRIFFSGIIGDQKYHNANILPLTGSQSSQENKLFSANWQHTISPMMFNEFRLGYNWMNWHVGSDATNSSNYSADLGLSNVLDDPNLFGLPVLSLGSYNRIGTPDQGWNQKQNIYSLVENLKIIKGRHTLTMGAEVRRLMLNMIYANGATGSLDFNGAYTSTDPTNAGSQKGTAGHGNAIADLLLGYPIGVSGPSSVGDLYAVRANNLNFFFQDDFRVTPKLTVNLGLRYELPPAFHSTNNSGAALDMTNGGGFMWANPDTAKMLQNTPGVPESKARCCADNTLTQANHKNFAPRIGFAYRPFDTDRFVVRGGYGLFYDLQNLWYSLTTYDDIQAYIGSAASYPVASGYEKVSPNQLSNLWAPMTKDFWYFQLPYWRPNPQVNWPENKSPYNQQWTLGMQFALKQDLLLDVSYVGSHGVHQPGYWYYNAGSMPTTLLPGNLAVCNTMRTLGDAQANGLSQCFQQDPVTHDTNWNQPIAGFVPVLDRNRFPNIGSTAYSIANLFDANYNSLQVRLNQRFKKGFQYQLNYTWSRTLDDLSAINNIEGTSMGVQDNNCIKCDFGPSSFDQTHRIVASGSYELPVGKGKKWSLGPANYVLGGWEVSGIYTLGSGYPFTITNGWDGSRGQDGVRNDFRRPNQVGDPNGAIPSSNVLSQFSSDIFHWFNPAAYAPAVDNVYGNVTRNSLRGPFFERGDLTFGKNFQITERQNVKFGLEIFNVFSTWHANPAFPQSSLTNTFFGSLVNVDYKNGAVLPESQQSGTRQLWNPRTLQFSLKYNF